jgi:8-oxo-dGTP pyrophosphatase MutT (NUDIX family)
LTFVTRRGMTEDLKHPAALKARISRRLYEETKGDLLYPEDVSRSAMASSVLFLMGGRCGNGFTQRSPCLIFNKRSLKVKQPGDLCFPGGRVSPGLDLFLSRLLAWPFSPLRRWAYWGQWRSKGAAESKRLGLLFATSLRESVEEMRLNPLGVTFLGPMPPQDLRMFRRVLYPMVVWVNRQERFVPNWEVEKIVPVPLKKFLEPDAYALYRIHFQDHGQGRFIRDFPCFRYQNDKEREILWGVTYRIVIAFLKMVFEFKPPSRNALPVIEGTMSEHYLNGAA